MGSYGLYNGLPVKSARWCMGHINNPFEDGAFNQISGALRIVKNSAVLYAMLLQAQCLSVKERGKEWRRREAPSVGAGLHAAQQGLQLLQPI